MEVAPGLTLGAALDKAGMHKGTTGSLSVL